VSEARARFGRDLPARAVTLRANCELTGGPVSEARARFGRDLPARAVTLRANCELTGGHRD